MIRSRKEGFCRFVLVLVIGLLVGPAVIEATEVTQFKAKGTQVRFYHDDGVTNTQFIATRMSSGVFFSVVNTDYVANLTKCAVGVLPNSAMVEGSGGKVTVNVDFATAPLGNCGWTDTLTTGSAELTCSPDRSGQTTSVDRGGSTVPKGQIFKYIGVAHEAPARIDGSVLGNFFPPSTGLCTIARTNFVSITIER